MLPGSRRRSGWAFVGTALAVIFVIVSSLGFEIRFMTWMMPLKNNRKVLVVEQQQLQQQEEENLIDYNTDKQSLSSINNTNKIQITLSPTTTTLPLPTTTTHQQTFTIAYCLYQQESRRFDPIGHSEWLAQWFGPHVFPNIKFILKPCNGGPKFLTQAELKLSIDEQLQLIGMSPDVDVRLCRFGSSEIINFFKTKLAPDCEIVWTTLDQLIPIAEKKYGPNHFLKDIIPSQGGWTHNERLYWPNRISQLRCKSGRRVPFFIRHNHEPWFEEVIGVGAQMDGKKQSISGKSLTIYLPLIIDSFGWRWIPGRPPGSTNHWSNRLGGSFHSLKEQGTRSFKTFNASLALAKKKYFVASINSHCAGIGAYLHSTIFRELFSFVLAEISHQPVHHLGSCPLTMDDRTIKSGLTPQQYEKISREFHPLSAVETYSYHKFGLVFENGRKLGYVTEKTVNAYSGYAIPIYFGPPPDEKLAEVINIEAVIYCDLPSNITVDAYKTWSKCIPDCYSEFRSKMEVATRPYFIQCAQEVIKYDTNDELWKHKISQNLAPVDEKTGELSGVWNGTRMGEIIRDTLRVLDYVARR
jgi:hypothetical protein